MGIAKSAVPIFFLLELFRILMLQTRGESSGGVAEKKRMF